MKTIKELADELGVVDQTVRNEILKQEIQMSKVRNSKTKAVYVLEDVDAASVKAAIQGRRNSKTNSNNGEKAKGEILKPNQKTHLEMSKRVEELEFEVENLAEQLNEKDNQLKAKEAALEEKTGELKAKDDALNEKDEEIRTIKQAHAEQIRSMTQDYDDKIRSMTESFTDRLLNLEENYSKEREEQRKQVSDLTAALKHQQELLENEQKMHAKSVLAIEQHNDRAWWQFWKPKRRPDTIVNTVYQEADQEHQGDL